MYTRWRAPIREIVLMVSKSLRKIDHRQRYYFRIEAVSHKPQRRSVCSAVAISFHNGQVCRATFFLAAQLSRSPSSLSIEELVRLTNNKLR